MWTSPTGTTIGVTSQQLKVNLIWILAKFYMKSDASFETPCGITRHTGRSLQHTPAHPAAAGPGAMSTWWHDRRNAAPFHVIAHVIAHVIVGTTPRATTTPGSRHQCRQPTIMKEQRTMRALLAGGSNRPVAVTGSALG
jgi:hypothetical protein